MSRCLQLARLGAGNVAPNPMVGAVLVFQDEIIGEGYHQQFGAAHAEVNCFDSVLPSMQQVISESTLYVSLEPCSHFGKTPPCADLVIKMGVQKVVIACRDPFTKVNGLGILKLMDAGVEVIEGILEEKAIELNKRFFHFQQQKRPFIFLKWAQTQDGFLAKPGFESLAISNKYSNIFTHKMRAEEAAIMVGTNTALYDNPALSTRYWKGRNPLRIVIDKHLKLLSNTKLLTDEQPTIIVNYLKEGQEGPVHYFKADEQGDLIGQLLGHLYKKNVQSLIVEGGSILLSSLLASNLWNEAVVISNNTLNIKEGIKAPPLPMEKLRWEKSMFSDSIQGFRNL